ncbi:MAG TPA: hypothetical protein VND93_34440, partial [Myxococcales bacterium]|nr:hypothetical protein [Myxococcales bacterium]
LSYPLVVPSVVAGAVGIGWALASRPAERVPRWVWLPPFAAAATVWLPLAWLLYDGLGVNALAGAAVMFGVVLASLSLVWGPLAEARPLLLACAVAWATGLVVQLAAPRYTEDHPRKLNLEYQLRVEEPKPTAKWTATGWERALPEPLRSAGHFGEELTQTYPWPAFR